MGYVGIHGGIQENGESHGKQKGQKDMDTMFVYRDDDCQYYGSRSLVRR